MLNFDIHFFFKNYDPFFKDKSRKNNSRIFRYSKLLKMIKKYQNICSIIPVGFSIEGRKIFKFQWGTGNIKVFIWSQMHGNETTGTKAMFDIFHFFLNQEKHDLVQFLKKNLTILFIPMLNPDGSEKFQRRNSVNIDLNRDVLRLQSPEIRILFYEIEKNHPHVLFNLHDQRSIYNIGDQFFNPAILSFLAPSVKGPIKITKERKKAMGLISSIAKNMKKVLPKIGSIGRYSDELFPTATGDFFQNKGYPCVLFEAGFYPKDNQKEIIIKYNALSILTGFYFLSTKEKYLEKNYKSYFYIPENKKNLFDKIYRKVQIQKEKKKFLVDIGIMKYEEFDPVKRNINFISEIVDIGDLSHFFAYEDIMSHGKRFHGQEGRNFPKIGDREFFQIF
ncbi:M14 family zinc carboxypeptidase [Blattabacterium cuenoti]|uniref:M14 family zinc carboxypeptidase n=1 Tax=Blattabacterium cuenoti TaxID=1653831 RepID=UPI00163CD049|nr:M14 family zinc carboxypeptidase [Blattabacterium cuenoti]